MKNFTISLGKLTSSILFIFWALGNPNVQVWHWIVPYAFETICNLVPIIAKWWVEK